MTERSRAPVEWASFHAASRASPLPQKRGAVRGSGEFSHTDRAPFVVRPSSCGSGLWPRCGPCMPRASFHAASRASPLPQKRGAVRGSGEFSHTDRAPFAVRASSCGSGLWPRCGSCMPRALFHAASRASPLPQKRGAVRGSGEFSHTDRAPFAVGRLLVGAASGAMRPMHAAGFVPRCIAGKPAPTKAGAAVRGSGEFSHTDRAPFAVWATSCGSGLWPRCGSCMPRASFHAASRASPLPQKRAPFVVRATSCGSGLWPRCGPCMPRASFHAASRASPLPQKRGAVRGSGEFSHTDRAPFAVRASSCGSGLWPRCGSCMPRASFHAASRASPLPQKRGAVRGSGEFSHTDRAPFVVRASSCRGLCSRRRVR